MILVLFIVFEVLASTCKLDWVLNTNFLQYLSVTFQSNVSNLWLVITKNKNTLFLAEALQIGALQLNTHFREIPAMVRECPSVSVVVCAIQKVHQRHLSYKKCLSPKSGSQTGVFSIGYQVDAVTDL